jgi:CheY-like chemotaxis protein
MAELGQINFLVVDHNPDSRQLLVRTLVRSYPRAAVHEASEGDGALARAKKVAMTAIITHRTFECDGETLVALFRRLLPTVPIIMVSGYDREARALAAGADAFLNYDKWLMIGTVVGNTLVARAQAARDPNAKAAESTPPPV